MCKNNTTYCALLYNFLSIGKILSILQNNFEVSFFFCVSMNAVTAFLRRSWEREREIRELTH